VLHLVLERPCTEPLSVSAVKVSPAPASSGHRCARSTAPQRPPVSWPPSWIESRRPPPLDAAPHRRSPLAEPCPRGHRPLVSLLFRRWPNRVPHLTGHLAHPRPYLTAPPLAGIDAAVENLGSPASTSGRKAMWAGPGRLWPNGLSPFQQYRFAFSSGIKSKIQLKFSLNF
jgi:hypothetical protein